MNPRVLRIWIKMKNTLKVILSPRTLPSHFYHGEKNWCWQHMLSVERKSTRGRLIKMWQASKNSQGPNIHKGVGPYASLNPVPVKSLPSPFLSALSNEGEGKLMDSTVHCDYAPPPACAPLWLPPGIFGALPISWLPTHTLQPTGHFPKYGQMRAAAWV